MIDTLTDTLMALWNSTWRGKILPGIIAFIIIGISMSVFFLLIKLPTFSHQPSTLNRSNKGSEKNADLALSPHSSGDGHTTVVPTSTPALVLIPTPTQVSDAPGPTPLPIELPSVASDPGVGPIINTDIGNPAINSIATIPANNVTHTSVRHVQPSPQPTTMSPVVPTATSIPPTATVITTNSAPASTISATPTIAITPTPIPTIIVAATPTAIPTSNPTPTLTYPATSESSPTASVTAIPAPTVPATGTLVPAVTATPTANPSNATATVVSKPARSAI